MITHADITDTLQTIDQQHPWLFGMLQMCEMAIEVYHYSSIEGELSTTTVRVKDRSPYNLRGLVSQQEPLALTTQQWKELIKLAITYRNHLRWLTEGPGQFGGVNDD